MFIDRRFLGLCSFCGRQASTKDHVPSKALLDEPFPNNLSTADSCENCNNDFSEAEEYFSCLIECIIQGTTKPKDQFRGKVSKTLIKKPSIASKIEEGKRVDENDGIVWDPDWNLVRKVVLKHARGHLCYEIGLQRTDPPVILDILPLSCMSEEEYEYFESFDDTGFIYPEIGSRAFINLFSDKDSAYDKWKVVQSGRYRYSIGQTNGDWVKFVFSEYLACRVVWD